MTVKASVAGAARRRLLIVNPNSNPNVTAQIKASAHRVLGPECRADVTHAPDSPFAIESHRDRIVAEPSTLALLRRKPGYDAYVIACFDDLAVDAARRFLRAPVVDAVSASVAMAQAHGQRFAVVTTVDAMVPGIETLLQNLGALERCAVLAADIGVAEAAAGGIEALRRLDETIARARETGAETIILGSAGLTGHSARLTRLHGLPVIDCIDAAILTADRQSRKRTPTGTP